MRSDQFVLQMTGYANFGVPFGQERIVPIFLATLAVRQKSQTIRFKTASEMLETFGMRHRGQKLYSGRGSISPERPRSGTTGSLINGFWERSLRL